MKAVESREELLLELKHIADWEKDQKDLWFWEKLGRLPFVLLDRITPKFIHQKIGQSIDELGSYIQSGGQYLIKEEDIYKKFSKDVPSQSEIQQLPLLEMDKVAKGLLDSRSKMATVQGATTGIGGLFTLAIDIPLLLGISLKVLQEMALTYGYDPRQKEERIFIVKCLQFTSSDIVGKKAILEELESFQTNRSSSQAISQLEGWREVVMTYRDNFGWKKLFQMVPIAGMIFGAYINKSTIQDVAETGMMLYRKRRILERLTLP
ncbi:EcsC family protein [Ammoniphilus sp. 3BR4]|uniref:EcsC family protein n=1 Tax=Ammoniphilus sp. 3BR4 TaxID=3158265 RepID=UPI003466662A